jgi:hypothetical protein
MERGVVGISHMLTHVRRRGVAYRGASVASRSHMFEFICAHSISTIAMARIFIQTIVQTFGL